MVRIKAVVGGSLDDAVSRVSGLEDAYSGGILTGYQYMGTNTIVQEVRPQSDVGLSYIKQPGDTLAGSDAGDQYTGLDRFGRVVDQNWVKLDSPTTPVDRIQYGYDNDSNVLYRNDLVNTTDSQVYTYDALNRLTGFTQGTINGARNGITGSPTDSGTYTLDSVGNMTTFGSGSRTVNAQNELTSGPYTPGYDADGNLTSGLPAVAAGSPVSLSLVYDAWNDVVGIRNVSGVPWESFYYDANGLRYESALSISPNTVTMTTFSASGEALEDDQGSGASEVRVTYVWGIPYVNDLVSLDQATGFFPLQVHHEYVQTDANYDVTSIVAYNASLNDAFVYTPYGKLTVLSGGSSAGDLNFLYQGGRYDSRDQTYLFGARTEAPSIGTWVQKDPAGAAYIDGTDLYQAFGDNAVNHVDPSGFESWTFIQPEITMGPDPSHTPQTPIGEITISLDINWDDPGNNAATVTLKFRWHPLTNLGLQESVGWNLKQPDNGNTSPITPEGNPKPPPQQRDMTASIELAKLHCGEKVHRVVQIANGASVWWAIDVKVTMGGPHSASEESVTLIMNPVIQQGNLDPKTGKPSLPPYPKP